jgi:SAM-dependent methyltransferase
MAESCPLCGTNDALPLFHERGHALVVCQGCELLYVSPYPQASDAVYSVVADYDYDELQILAAERHYRSTCRFYDEYYPRLRPELIGARSFLDVGCGTGRLLELAREFSSLQRVGIELNQSRAEFARRVAGCEVVRVPVERYTAAEPVDVITLMNVFSHLPNVNEVFAALHVLLSPAGRLILKVGEMAGDVRRDAVYDWQIPDHLQFLGLRTIERLAHVHQLRIVRHERVPLADELFARSRWLVPGRSRVRDLAKQCVAHTPGALRLLRALYRRRHGTSIYSSLIVLQRDSAGSGGGSGDKGGAG